MQQADPIDTDNRTGDYVKGVAPVTRQLIYSLALVPIVPAMTFITWFTAQGYNILPWPDAVRWFNLFFATLSISFSILIWRTVVVWTLGRKWLTALVSLIPFVQVVYARPLWDAAGCASNDVLQVGQEQVGIGVWIWLLVWIWWGWEKLRMSEDLVEKIGGPVRMSPTGRRLASSIGSIPLIVGVFWIVVIAVEDGFLSGASDETQGSVTLGATVPVAMCVWLLIWRHAVLWRPGVLPKTILGGAFLMWVPAGLIAMLVPTGIEALDTAISSIPVIGWGVWMAWTVTFWPMRAGSDSAQDVTPRCLKCAYPLIGLTGTRCPECGYEPTIDQLWAATMGDAL
ncbi:MAG: hypothetical protein JSU63_13980 [Phycisphaerales bacterium]|nr:MAG: hypothetical protein JSU63_13980 [Phycisphaerales bacterium]